MALLLPVLETEGRSAKELAGFTRAPLTNGGETPGTARGTVPPLLVWFSAEGQSGALRAAPVTAGEVTPLVRVWVDVRLYRSVRAQGRVDTAGAAGDRYVWKWYDGATWLPLGTAAGLPGPRLPLDVVGDIRGARVNLAAAVVAEGADDVLLGLFYEGATDSAAATGNVLLRFEGAPVATPTFGPHRQWRILVTGTESDATGSNVRLAELQFRATVSGPSLSTGGTAIESGHTSALGFPLTADHAFNGTALDANDAWGAGSETPPPWVGYVHPAAVDIGAVAITMCPSFPGHAPTDFAVQYRDADGDAWVTAWTVARAVGWVEGQTRVFTPGAAWPVWRVVVLETTDSLTGGGCSIGELEFLVGGVNQCVGGAARADTYSAALSPDRAFNGGAGDFLDCWATDTDGPHWLGYVFLGPTDAALPIDAVAITARPGYPTQAPTDFLVEYALPDGTWHTRYHLTCFPSFWSGGGRRVFTPSGAEIVG